MARKSATTTVLITVWCVSIVLDWHRVTGAGLNHNYNYNHKVKNRNSGTQRRALNIAEIEQEIERKLEYYLRDAPAAAAAAEDSLPNPSKLSAFEYDHEEKAEGEKRGREDKRPELMAQGVKQKEEDRKDPNRTSAKGKLYQRVHDILTSSPLIDGHNDLMWNIRKFIHNQINDFNFTVNLRTNFVYPWSNSTWSHTDIPRLRKGLVGAQFFAAYVPCEAAYLNAVQITLEQIDLIKRLVAKYPDDLVLALSADDIERAHREGKIASLISVEGGHAIGNSLATLRAFYHLGVRSLTLTHQCNNPWADSSLVDTGAQKPQHGGLTEFGRSVVREMNRLGMLVDLSHTSKMTMKDAMNESQSPVVFSHSSAFAICNSSRNVPDDILKELVFDGGIIMVTFYNFFVKCQENATVRDVAGHINYIRDLIGPKHIGIGGGFDGINKTPKDLEDASMYPNLFMELAKDPRWTDDDLKKLAGQNFLKVFREAEYVRDMMKKNSIAASDDLISPRYLQKHAGCQYNVNTTAPATAAAIH